MLTLARSTCQAHVKQKGKGERGRVLVEEYVTEGKYAGRYKVPLTPFETKLHSRLPRWAMKMNCGNPAALTGELPQRRQHMPRQPESDV